MPLLSALKVASRRLPVTATVPSVVASPDASCASMLLIWLSERNTPSSVSVPTPSLVTVMEYGPPTRRPRAL